jgi:uracil phosphoribosyltransferase
MQEKAFFVLNHQPNVGNHFLTELRRKGVQEDRMRFRRNLERVGEILAYELSKTLQYAPQSVITPLDTAQAELISHQPVLISILRAGLPLHQGILNYFDQADCGFVGAFRAHHSAEEEGAFDIALQYFTLPDIAEREVILIDPMLASGKTILKVYKSLYAQARPSHLHIVSAIASPEGVEYLRQNIDTPFSLWLGAVDDHLNDKAYIVPGLGDAGDLAYGPKN